MQLIDYYVGIPLCFFLSIFESVKKLIFKPIFCTPKKVLFIELSEMGSAFLAYSTLKRAVNDFSKENVYFLIFKKNRESVDLLNLIPYENVITIEDKNFFSFCLGTFKALTKIWQIKIDATIDLELFSRATSIISFFTFANIKAGFDNFTDEGLYRGNFITHRVMLNNHQHIAINFLSLYESLFADNKIYPPVKKDVSPYLLDLPVITPSSDDVQPIWQKLTDLNPQINKNSKILVLNPDPGLLSLRGWPTNYYLETTYKLMADDPNLFVVVMGLKRSSDYFEQVCPKEFIERCINFCGHTKNLYEVVILLHLSKLLITNDSGPAHLACLADINSIVFFGPETPTRYGPLNKKTVCLFANLNCSPCYTAANHRHSICKENLCLQSISPQKVISIAKSLL